MDPQHWFIIIKDAKYLESFKGEKKYIFHDKSADGFKDDPDLAKLTTFDNVKLSSHIAFYTDQVNLMKWFIGSNTKLIK